MNPTVSDISNAIEAIAPLWLQESYDNSGLLLGDKSMKVHSALLCLDITEVILEEAKTKDCNLIIAHHPLIFGGIKRLTGENEVQRCLIKAIQYNIAIYACHTNLDNVLSQGVNQKIAQKLQLTNSKVLLPKENTLYKLQIFVPHDSLEDVKNAIFNAGAGHIGHYSECSFATEGTGTFTPLQGANPTEGRVGEHFSATEMKLEVIVPAWKKSAVEQAFKSVHPYEEVAHEWIRIDNTSGEFGSGAIGNLPKPMNKQEFLHYLKDTMNLKSVKFTVSADLPIAKVAVCGGSGSFLIAAAKAAGAQAYVTSDVKYHEFFDAGNSLLLCDIGHYESEKFTMELFCEILSAKFPNFATIFAETVTNPIDYI
jgi:dinuclear metal center YbgI/SA1388 family protein